jgi:hypothetical protein
MGKIKTILDEILLDSDSGEKKLAKIAMWIVIFVILFSTILGMGAELDCWSWGIVALVFYYFLSVLLAVGFLFLLVAFFWAGMYEWAIFILVAIIIIVVRSLM